MDTTSSSSPSSTLPSVPLPRRRPRILIGLTGSVATVKYQELVLALNQFAAVRIVPTEKAVPFIDISNTTYKPEYHDLFKNTISTEEYEKKEDIPSNYLTMVIDPSTIPSSSSSSSNFPPSSSFYRLSRKLPETIYTDRMEWSDYRNVHNDPVLHIELRKWCDICIIAPCSANTLAKLVHGQCDNLLTTILRAWEFRKQRILTTEEESSSVAVNGKPKITYQPLKPVCIAPAMNTAMWNHPITQEQIHQLETHYGYTFIYPQTNKVLACGDVGTGAMASVDTIVEKVKQELRSLGWRME